MGINDTSTWIQNQPMIFYIEIMANNFLLHSYNRHFSFCKRHIGIIKETSHSRQNMAAHLANLLAWWNYVYH